MSPPQQPLDLHELKTSWHVALRAERKSSETILTYLRGVDSFLRWCQDSGSPAELTRATVNAFSATLLSTGRQPATVRARQTALRHFSRWLVEEGEQAHDGLLGLKPPKLDSKLIDPLGDEQLRALLAACRGRAMMDRRDEAIIRFMLETGARAGEVVAMTVPDTRPADGVALLRRGKGGKGRIVPFGPEAGRAIDRYIRARRQHRLAAEDELWLGDRGKTFSYSGLYWALAARARAAGIDGFHPHLLRHTAAHRWLAAGGSEGGLMAVAGWSSPAMLSRYTQARAADRAAVEARHLNLGEV